MNTNTIINLDRIIAELRGEISRLKSRTSILEDIVTINGILLPRLTTVKRDALSPTNGLVIYNTDDNEIQSYVNGGWVSVDTTAV